VQSNDSGQRPVKGGRVASLVHGLLVAGSFRRVVQLPEQEPEWRKVEEQGPGQELDAVKNRFPSLPVGFLVQKDGLKFHQAQSVDNLPGESDPGVQDSRHERGARGFQQTDVHGLDAGCLQSLVDPVSQVTGKVVQAIQAVDPAPD
jgi:hypothetical protein